MAQSILSHASFLPVMLPHGVQRQLALPDLQREEKFLQSYERDVLFYDVFWSADGRQVILHGPAPIGLEQASKAMRIVAQPSGLELRIKGHHSTLVQLYSVAAPSETKHLDIHFGGQWVRAQVGANHSAAFRDENLLFTLSQNNDLDWIRDWAQFHVVHHGVTSVILFDNNSTRYTVSEIEQVIAGVPGIKAAAVVPTPFRYTREDAVHPTNLFWAHFLQPSVMVNMFRRYGSLAGGIMNCDIDELLVPLATESAFTTARQSRSGTVYFRDCWIEPVPVTGAAAPYHHADFDMVASSADYHKGPTAKWVMDPKRRWLSNLRQHPYPHAIQNRPFATRHKPDTAYVAHFKAISTGWKYDRSARQGDGTQDLRVEPVLKSAMERAFTL